MKYILIIFFALVELISSQELVLINSFGEFESASSFDIDLNGNFYISDVVDNDIKKLDPQGDLIISIGGYGWGESSFDRPASIITNTLSVYVADENNDRVQRFDKDLNFLSEFSGRSENNQVEFAYPISIKISKMGDLYILENDNNRILKFNLTGEYLTEIGANDAGTFALNNPKDFSLDNLSNIYVIDDKKIKVFDQYGNGKSIIELEFTPNKIELYSDQLLLVDNYRLVFFSIKNRKVSYELTNIFSENSDIIIDAKRIDNFIYILTSKKINKFRIQF